MGTTIFGAATTVVIAASVGFQTPNPESPAAALTRAEARWQANRPASYTFGIVLACECFPKGASFRVSDGRVTEPRGADSASRRFTERWGTVERLFAVIRGALAAGGHRVMVKYDAELGYPIWADLDPSREIIDDELFFRVVGFRTLNATVRRSPAGEQQQLQPPSGQAEPLR